ncbi:Papain family cysteine protease [Sporobacter termitidis DSM 10068]|uniref:Papain family cysteine protease n=1 Tax=Sporobacter termitidis DSM 10068 TaxID=1123282 RepID=A0A1M5YJM8_9FIRM|nr:C1 family peptidase [Sporobacter termitidis]SHI12215.1 Papain family cysteine protease [Sporobacter termitidis DSM 10068]
MHQYRLIRQREDRRDYRLPRLEGERLPRLVDLRSRCPAVFDQGTLGSCTANAGASARMMLAGTPVALSRMFLYYQERALRGNVREDSGAQMRDICKALKRDGICEERFAPYDIDKFKERPSAEAYINARKYTIASYATFDGDTADDIDQIRQYLATKKLPVMIGMDIYESFESRFVARTGSVPMPDVEKEALLGGHAALIVGYNDVRKVLIVRNSWGVRWGAGGYFYLPYEYVESKLAYDSWTIAV